MTDTEIRNRIKRAIARIGKVLNEDSELKDIGFSVTVGNSTYSLDGVVKTKLTLTPLTETGKPVNTLEAEMKRYGRSYGLGADCVGKTFRTFRGDTYRILGLKTRNRKLPVICENIRNGKQYKFAAAEVLNHLMAGKETKGSETEE